MDTRGWGPAGNTGGMLAVEVRQGTLGVDDRGWGPAANTVDRGSQLDEDDEEDEDDEDDEDDKDDEEDEEEEEDEEAGRRQAAGGSN